MRDGLRRIHGTTRILKFTLYTGKSWNVKQRNKLIGFTFHKDHSYDTTENGWRDMDEKGKNETT
jgi:hypothetical protein